jgi:hypothetical protein
VNASSSTLYFDGVNLSTKIGSPGRRFRADPECLRGGSRAYAHVCALPDEDAKLPFDFPEIQQVRRDALAWWIPMLGESFVCLTTLAVDSVNYGGAITVARDDALLAHDPFARIFAGTIVETDLFSAVPPPAGPVIERYRGVAWPGGRFPAARFARRRT